MRSTVAYTPVVTASPRADVARATGWGVFVASLVLAGIYVGSRRLRDFDAALVPYAGASVFSAFGLGYRYSMWLTKPPTRLYWRRGWRLFFAPSQRRAESLAPGRALRREHRRAALHREAIAAALGGTLVPGLGLRARRGGDVSAVVRLGALRDRRRRARALSGVRLWRARVLVRPRQPAGAARLQRARYLGGAGDRRRDDGAVASGPRPRRAGGPAVRRRSAAARDALRGLDHRRLPDGLDAPDARAALRVSVAAARRHGDLHAALPAVRQVLPHLPAAGAARRRLLPRGRRDGRSRAVRPVRRAVRLADAHRRSEAGRAGARDSVRRDASRRSRRRRAHTTRTSARRAAARTSR